MESFLKNNIDVISSIGWTLIHSTWQFALIALIYKASAIVLSHRSPSLRYRIGVAFMSLLVICFVTTFYFEYQNISGNNIPSDQLLLQSEIKVNPTSLVQPVSSVAYQNNPVNVLIETLNDISPYLTCFWCFGVVICLCRIVNGASYLYKQKKQVGKYVPELEMCLKHLIDKIGIKRKVSLKVSESANYPFTFGMLESIIVIPSSYLLQIPNEQMQMILAHELAHIKRLDFVINFFQTILDGVFFYNPFYKYISDAVRDEREYCCDDIAASHCGSGRQMAVALTNIKILNTYPSLALASSPIKSKFQQRVSRLIEPGKNHQVPSKSLFLGLTGLFLLLFLAKCTGMSDSSRALPTVKDSVQQVLGDNQAGSKIEVLRYSKSGQAHELFLVSETNGTPKYAYLDRDKISSTELAELGSVLKAKRNITNNEIEKAKSSKEDKLSDSIWKLSAEIDSLKGLSDHATSNSRLSKSAIEKQLTIKNQQLKEASMAKYKIESAHIPAQVGLHKLLTEIIQTGKYTAEQQTELSKLISQNNN